MFTRNSGLIDQGLQSFCSNANTTNTSSGASSIWYTVNSSIRIAGPSNSSCLKGTSGLNVIFSGSADDGSYNISLPFDFLWLSRTFNGNVFVGSKSYVTFGGESNQYQSLDGTRPNMPTIFIGSANNSVQHLMSGYDARGWRVRFEGTSNISGFRNGSNIIWELLFKFSGGMELCTGTLEAHSSSISALSDGIQSYTEVYSLKSNSFYTFDSQTLNRMAIPTDSCDLSAFIKMYNADLALSGPTFQLPRYTLPPGSYFITASLSAMSNCSWMKAEYVGNGSYFVGDGNSTADYVNPTESSSNYRCHERMLHYDEVNLQVLNVRPSLVTYINGAVSSGSPVLVESGSLVCVRIDGVSSCQVTQPTAFSESLNPKDPEFEDIQRSFKELVSKSRQFLSSNAENLVIFGSSEFSRLFCNRCNGKISPEITLYVDQRFGIGTDDEQGRLSENSGDDLDPDETLLIVQSSNVSYSLEQVCFQFFPLNSTHFAKNCSMFVNATRSRIVRYANDSDSQGFSLRENLYSVSIFVCNYNQSYFNVLYKDPSVYSNRLNSHYNLQWSCIIRPNREPSSGYHSKGANDIPCSNFTASPYYGAATFFDQINSSMVARISCIVSSPHIPWFSPAEAVVVLYPFAHMSVLTQQRIPVNPSLSSLTPENFEMQRAHLLRHSNSSSPFLTLSSNPISEFNFASDIKWESRVPWLNDISSALDDSMFDSDLFVLNSQLSLSSTFLSLGFAYVFRASHFFRGQLSGFSEIVVNMSSPFFEGKVSVLLLPSGLHRISMYRVEVEDEERPLQFSFLQSLDFGLTLQPIGYMQTYSGPLYNDLRPSPVASVFVLTRSASLCTIRTNISVMLSTSRANNHEFILNQFRFGYIDFFLSAHMTLQSYRMAASNFSLERSVTDTGPYSDQYKSRDSLFEKLFLEPFVKVMSLQNLFSEGSHQLFLSPPNEVNFTEILKENSTEVLNLAVPGVQGNEHAAAVFFEAFRAYMNGSFPSLYICRRVIKVISRLVQFELPFSSTVSSSLFGMIARCFDPEVQELADKIAYLAKYVASPPPAISPGVAPLPNVTNPSSTIPLAAGFRNPPQRTLLSALGSMRGTCYMRVGAVESDLTDVTKRYSVIPATGDPSTWNVVFNSTLVVSSTNLSVYRYFSRGSNLSPNDTQVGPAFMSNSFGGSWSDSDSVFAADVANSSRISGLWGGPGTGLTALFKFFDFAQQGTFGVLVELGWVLLDESKAFDETSRSDAELLTFPFDNSWNVTQEHLNLNVAPYRCSYDVKLPVSTDPTPRLVMPSNTLHAGDIFRPPHHTQRHLLQESGLELLRNDITSSQKTLIRNLMDDFSSICDRMRITSSTSGAPVSFLFYSTMIYSRAFYTRAGVSMETPRFNSLNSLGVPVACSSILVNIHSLVPADPSLDFHRSSICIGVTAKRLAPATPTAGGTIGATKIKSADLF